MKDESQRAIATQTAQQASSQPPQAVALPGLLSYCFTTKSLELWIGGVLFTEQAYTPTSLEIDLDWVPR